MSLVKNLLDFIIHIILYHTICRALQIICIIEIPDIFTIILYYLCLFYICLGMTFELESLTLLALPPPSVKFVADHPFTLSIISRNNDVVFIGRLSKF